MLQKGVRFFRCSMKYDGYSTLSLDYYMAGYNIEIDSEELITDLHPFYTVAIL